MSEGAHHRGSAGEDEMTTLSGQMCLISQRMNEQVQALYEEDSHAAQGEQRQKEKRATLPSVQSLQAAAACKAAPRMSKARHSVLNNVDAAEESDTENVTAGDDDEDSSQDAEDDGMVVGPELSDSDKSDGVPHVGEYDDIDDFDIKKSGEVIQQMLKQLEQSTQMEVMERLYADAAARAAEVSMSAEEIDNAELEYVVEADSTQDSLQHLEKSLEERELDGFQELHKFKKQLNRSRLAINSEMAERVNRRRARLSKRIPAANLKKNPKKDKRAQFQENLDLEGLKSRLAMQAAEARQALEVEDPIHGDGLAVIQPTDLINKLSGQQNEMAGIRDMAEQQAQRLKLLRTSLAVVKGEVDGGDAGEGVLELIKQVKKKVNEPSYGKHGSQGSVGDQEKNDIHLLKTLEKEVEELRANVSQLKVEMESLANSGIPMPVRNAAKEEPDKSQLQLEAENGEPKEESENPYLRLEALTGLVTNGEVVLLQVENEKALFLDSLARSKRPLINLPAEEDDALPDADSWDGTGTGILQNENLEQDQEDKAKSDLELCQKETEDEKMAKASKMAELEVKKKEVDEHKQKAKEFKDEVLKCKNETREKIQSADCGYTIETADEGDEILTQLRGEIEEMRARTQQAEFELEEERRRAQLEEEESLEPESMQQAENPDMATSMTLESVQSNSKGSTSGAQRSTNKGDSRAAEGRQGSETPSGMASAGESDAPQLAIAEEEVVQPQEAEAVPPPPPPPEPIKRRVVPPKPKNQKEADMQKLLQIQKENAELAMQVQMLEEQVEKVESKKKKSRGKVDLSFLEKPDAEESQSETKKPVEEDPEHLELQRQIRKKQKDINKRRDTWAMAQKAEKMQARQSLAMGAAPPQEDLEEGGEEYNTGADPAQHTPHDVFQQVRRSINAV